MLTAKNFTVRAPMLRDQ